MEAWFVWMGTDGFFLAQKVRRRSGRRGSNKVDYDGEAVDELLVSLFLEAHGEAPREIVIELDATDLPVHGHQEQRFFHGFYNHHFYLPLYIMSGDHLLRVRLRAANIDASAGNAGRSRTHRATDSISSAGSARQLNTLPTRAWHNVAE